MEAVRQVYNEGILFPPTDSWMVERGLERYFEFELSRFPQLRALFRAPELSSTVVGSIPSKLKRASADDTVRAETPSRGNDADDKE